MIPNSSDPLWAAQFRLSSAILGMDDSASIRAKGKRGGLSGSPLSSTPLGSVSSVVLEVWDSVFEGNPVMLGAAEVSSDLLRGLLSSHDHRDSKTLTDEDGVVGEAISSSSLSSSAAAAAAAVSSPPSSSASPPPPSSSSVGSLKGSRLHLLDLHLGLPIKHHSDGGVEHEGDQRTSRTTKRIAESSTKGVLSVSLERVLPEKVLPSEKRVANSTNKTACTEEQGEKRDLPADDANPAPLSTEDDGNVNKGMETAGTGLSKVRDRKERSLFGLCSPLASRENRFSETAVFSRASPLPDFLV